MRRVSASLLASVVLTAGAGVAGATEWQSSSQGKPAILSSVSAYQRLADEAMEGVRGTDANTVGALVRSVVHDVRSGQGDSPANRELASRLSSIARQIRNR